MNRTAIVIVTYNRLPILQTTIERVRAHTTGDYKLIIADDGSTDGTAAYCRNLGLTVITGPNRGIAGNKNRGLYAAMQHTNADVIFLLEDDCWPNEPRWNLQWESMTRRWHHVCFGPVSTWPADYIHAGRGTVDDPYRSRYLTAQNLGVTRTAVERVGYFAPEFKGYGHEHAEWTFRFAQHGYFAMDDFVCCNHGLELADAGTFYSPEQVSANGKVMSKLRRSWRSRRYRKPWLNLLDKRRFLREIAASFAHGNSIL